METIYYNYDQISLDKQEKTVEQDRYIKYSIERPSWMKRMEPSLTIDTREYTIQHISLFRSHLPEINGQSSDGILIIENVPIDNSNTESVFFILLIQSDPSSPPSELDELFMAKTNHTIHLNSLMDKEIAFIQDRTILFSQPIHIQSSFEKMVTCERVGTGMNSFNIDDLREIRCSNIKNKSVNVNVVEGFRQKKKHRPSTNQIPMVPIDSDFLNGVYQTTMLRTLYDIYIFMVLMS
jgi:hypothetical protein